MTELESIAPKKKRRVIDLVEEAGVDVSDWGDFKGGASKASTNPKYCYEWSYIQPGKVVVLNLWHVNNRLVDGRIAQRNNFRVDAAKYKSRGESTWSKRAMRIDEALLVSLKENLPIRVILLSGDMRDPDGPDVYPSKVKFRALDPELWTIANYDRVTGEHTLARGVLTDPFVDQFSIDQQEKGAGRKAEVTSSPFIRDPEVRRIVLHRAKGACEYCGQRGFAMPNGSTYLETHHIEPLCDGGPDVVSNVIALCPNDHRRAHFGMNPAEFQDELQAIVLRKLREQHKSVAQAQVSDSPFCL
jgi:5-methylcytosine-specific restriction protein A